MSITSTASLGPRRKHRSRARPRPSCARKGPFYLARLAAVAAGGRAGRARARGYAHLAAQVLPLAQPQLESQEQAMMGCRKGSLVCWETRAERIKARGKFSNKLRKYTVKKPRCPHASSAWIRTLRYHDSALSRQISRAGPCALAARGACWRTLGTTKAGESGGDARVATDILRVVSGRSVGSRSSGRGVKQKHVSREEGLE